MDDADQSHLSKPSSALSRLDHAADNLRRAILAFRSEARALDRLVIELEGLAERVQKHDPPLLDSGEVVKLPRILENGPTYRGPVERGDK